MKNDLYHRCKAWISAPKTYIPPGLPWVCAAYVEAVDEIERLREFVSKLADELESELNARYEFRDQYQSEMRRFKLEMETVTMARAAITNAYLSNAKDGK